MKTALVGYTGFVGSNLYLPDRFDAKYNSKNIESAYGTNPDLLIYAGVRAEKYLANRDSIKDLKHILQAEENILKINPKRLVLISTVDVFETPQGVDETSVIDTVNLLPYGFNRYQLENWVRTNFSDALIVRLPGLFGKNIKKNFIYDYINFIPFMLKESKYQELLEKDPELGQYYIRQNNGFYKIYASDCDKEKLKNKFRTLGFSALNFTDSRSKYQFYDLSRLWTDMQIVLRAGIKLWHPATEPVSAGEIYQFLTGGEFVNEITAQPAFYDYRTKHGDLFGRSGGYILSKQEVLEDIRRFVNESAVELAR